VPAIPSQGLCTTAEINAFISACVDPGTSCGSWVNANVAGSIDGGAGTPCGNCVEAPTAVNNGGVWIDPEGLFAPNYAGCIQILDPTHGPACGAAFDNVLGCQSLACDYCPGVGVNDYDNCVNATTDAGCAGYQAVQTTACAYDFTSTGVAVQCSPSSGGTGDYLFTVTLICGAADAGSDAGTDGGSTAQDAAKD
jgi:hypothetical protein